MDATKVILNSTLKRNGMENKIDEKSWKPKRRERRQKKRRKTTSKADGTTEVGNILANKLTSIVTTMGNNSVAAVKELAATTLTKFMNTTLAIGNGDTAATVKDWTSSASTKLMNTTPGIGNGDAAVTAKDLASTNLTKFMNTTIVMENGDNVTDGVTTLSDITGLKNTTAIIEAGESDYFFSPGWIFIISLFLVAVILWVSCKRYIIHFLGFRRAGPKARTCASCWQSLYDGEVPPGSLFSKLQSDAMK